MIVESEDDMGSAASNPERTTGIVILTIGLVLFVVPAIRLPTLWQERNEANARVESQHRQLGRAPLPARAAAVARGSVEYERRTTANRQFLIDLALLAGGAVISWFGVAWLRRPGDERLANAWAPDLNQGGTSER